MKISCPNCGKRYDAEPIHIGQKMKCFSCSAEFEIKNPFLMPCPDCFALVSKRASTCPHCGAPLANSNIDDIQDEQDIMLFHPSAMNYFWVVLLGIILVPLIIGILILLWTWIEIHFTTYRITNLRIIVIRGWIARVQKEVWIKDMRGASMGQTFWQRILGIGDIAIGTAATAGTEISMCGIANPQEVVDKINALRH